MTNKTKRTLTPRLRFPEFRDEPGWTSNSLSELTSAIFDGTHQTPRYIDEGIPFFSVENIVSGAENKFISHADHAIATSKNKPERNDILFTRIGKIGFSQVVTLDYEFSIYVTLAVLKPLKEYDPYFLHYSIQSPFCQSEILHNSLLNAVPCKINMDSLRATKALVTSRSEQQKIADCLSSLDELIAAEGRKLETLRAHKKGLMQQLFPRPGETRPRLRFPEFRKARDWETHELGPMTKKVGSGITPRGGEKNYKKNGRPFIRSQNVGWGELLLDDVVCIDEDTHASLDATEIQVSDVLLNITGASIGRSAVADTRVAGGNVNQHVCIIRTMPDKLNPALLNQYLISQNGQKQIDSFQAGGNRQGLNFAQIRSFLIPLPPTTKEQHMVAACFSSLDVAIAAQIRRISILQIHKKGLMQQLFPSPEETEA